MHDGGAAVTAGILEQIIELVKEENNYSRHGVNAA